MGGRRVAVPTEAVVVGKTMGDSSVADSAVAVVAFVEESQIPYSFVSLEAHQVQIMIPVVDQRIPACVVPLELVEV